MSDSADVLSFLAIQVSFTGSSGVLDPYIVCNLESCAALRLYHLHLIVRSLPSDMYMYVLSAVHLRLYSPGRARFQHRVCSQRC
jgi:hypothetical protein